MPDELRDAIEGTLEHTCCEDFETQATSILSLIDPILADAAKWRRVKEMATKSDCSGCKYNHENWCVLDGMCCFSAVVDALEGDYQC